MKPTFLRTRGLTLIELLVVIAIVGILAGIVLASISKAREKAQVAKAVLEIREMQKQSVMFNDDTQQYPGNCTETCVAGADPFLNSLGVSGWKGPYGSIYDKEHSWGGHMGVTSGYDIDGGGNDFALVLNDDRPGTNDFDNGGPIPLSSLLAIDAMIDDGDLATGYMVGNGAAGTAAGEAFIKVVW